MFIFNHPVKNIHKLIRFVVLCFSIGFLLIGHTEINEDISQYRLQVALKLFPRIVATDQQLDEKLNKHGKIYLLVYYTNSKQQAKQFFEKLAAEIPRIGNHDIEYFYSNTLITEFGDNNLPTGVFLAEPLNQAELKKITDYSRKNQRLLFSPFEGDVERGVSAGIYISNKITPYFNRKALTAANINLHKSLLKVSTHYE